MKDIKLRKIFGERFSAYTKQIGLLKRWTVPIAGTVVGIGTCQVGAMLSLQKKKKKERSEWYSRRMRLWGALFSWNNRVTVTGMHNIPADQPVILASNHQSYFDAPLFHLAMPVTFCWISRHDLFNWPFVGWSLHETNAISVDRESRESGRSALKKAIEVLKSGRNIVIFPEGTWGDRSGRMRPFKQGVVEIAKGAKVPVVPVTIVGSHQANPPFTYELTSAPIHFVIHPPMEYPTRGVVAEQEWLSALRKRIGKPLPYGDSLAEF